MEDKEFQQKFEEWKEKFRRTSFLISRIPEQTKTELMQWFKKDFCDDYGMGLKWLWDHYKGTLPNQNEEVNTKIDILADEVAKLKEQLAKLTQEPKAEKVIEAADGTKYRKGLKR